MSALYRAPEVVVLLVVLAVVVASLEFGFRLAKHVPVEEAQFNRIATPILALIGLVLAFSYSLAADRMADRRAANVQEVNSIGTFWLRTALLPDPTRSAMRVRVRRYVDVHFEHRAAGIDEARLRVLEREAEQLQKELWKLLMGEAQHTPESTMLLVTPALNAMFDDTATALAARENRLPDTLILFLFALVAAASFLAGYGRAPRHPVLWIALAVVVGGVLAGLLDMDRPRRGLIVTDQTPFVRLRDSIQSD